MFLYYKWACRETDLFIFKRLCIAIKDTLCSILPI